MTLNLNEHKWLKPALFGALLVGAVLAWLHLAGAVVLAGIGRDYNAATPMTYIQYATHFGGHKRIGMWLWVGAAVSTVALLAPLFLFMRPSKRSLHGDARFASASEIKKAGLVDGKGIIVGKKGADYLMFDGPQHVLVSAPTRSGKGVSVVIPNLLTWPQSVVGLDIKRENWDLTSGYRSKYGQRCYLFNPGASDGRTHRYNPLERVARIENPEQRYTELAKIADYFLTVSDKGAASDFLMEGRELFVAAGLLAHAATGGRMLPSLGAGLLALLLARALLQQA